MVPRYMSERVKLPLTLTVVLMFAISTASTSNQTERNSYTINNGIKLCAECAEHGQCAITEYNIETLTCHLLRCESKIEKEVHATHDRSRSHVATVSCMCCFGQRCLKTISGKEDCVQVSASTCDASEDLTFCKTVPTAPRDSDPHATPSQRDRHLYFASMTGDLEKAKRLLARGRVNINRRGGRLTKSPVMAAAYKGHRDLVDFLVCRGADVSLVDKNGNNALHLACWSGDLKTVKLILSLNVVDFNTKNKYDETVADIARGEGHQRVVDLLVSCGAH